MIAVARAGREPCCLAVHAKTVGAFGTREHGLRQVTDP